MPRFTALPQACIALRDLLVSSQPSLLHEQLDQFTMPDSPPSKKLSIPSWQKEAAPAAKKAQKTSSSDDDSPPSNRSTAIDQANRFLQDESIKDEPIERKVAFLQSKGLKDDEIEAALGQGQDQSPTADHKSGEEREEPGTSQLRHQTQYSLADPSLSQESEHKTTTKAMDQEASSSARERPIITYPEFLAQAHKPTPLVTSKRLLYTLYIASGTAATVYGASKFILSPMFDTLTSARQELGSVAQSRLSELNKKLEGMVSEIPPDLGNYKDHRKVGEGEEDATETGSVTSDPTELFHRDIGTQTTPNLSQRPSRSTSDSGGSEAVLPNSQRVVEGHVGRLETIRSHMSEFLSTENALAESDDAIRDRVSELQTYLDGLTYQHASYSSSGPYGPDDLSRGKSSSVEEEAIAKVKAEIRGVKGVLLSARNFPSTQSRSAVAGR